MSFFEQRFDTRLSFGAVGGPVWSTTRVVVDSGRRSVDRRWSFPLHRYNVAHCVKNNADFEVVRAFFYNVSGSFDGFRFKDFADFQSTQSNSSLVYLTGSTWQLYRDYTVGSRTFKRKIQKPCASPAPVIRRLRSGVWSTASATVDTTSGIATIASHATGDTYAWEGEFDVPVAFADDAMEAEIVNRNAADGYLVQWPSIVLEEIRL